MTTPRAVIDFYGVRGSCPTPSRPSEDIERVRENLLAFEEAKKTNPGMTAMEFLDTRAHHQKATYGGNTACVGLRMGGEQIILDMGTGLRIFGNKIIGSAFANKGTKITFCVSHVHWDHIQGVPFFALLYLNRHLTGINNFFAYHGGTEWQRDVETCLRGQMNEPVFPITLAEIMKFTAGFETNSVYDGLPFEIGPVKTRVRKLDHPQTTYGYRFVCDDAVIAYTTDQEPRDPRMPAEALLDLVSEADVWITDCQYTYDTYHGLDAARLQRYGWGHSYPLAVAHTAAKAKPKKIVLFHHEPNYSSLQIFRNQEETLRLVQELGCESEVVAASEEMQIVIE